MQDNLVGRVIGQYEILGLIRQDGLAQVYRAEQQTFGRMVALKILPALTNAEAIAIFEHEAKKLSLLEHAHILPIYDYGSFEDRPYLVMRYTDGGTLADRIKDGAFAFADYDKILKQISQALDYAYQKTVIHRNLNPSNILLDAGGNALLSDFGISHLADESNSLMIGTPAYMAPEQWQNEAIDHRTDLYALGVISYEALTGNVPFEGNSAMDFMMKHINDKVPNISTVRPDAPSMLKWVFDAALAKKPEDRYLDAKSFYEAYHDATITIVSPWHTPPDGFERKLPKIFICHSMKDVDFVNHLTEALVQAGGSVWRAAQDNLQEGMENTEVLLLVISPSAMSSPDVQNQWEYYFSLNKPIIPLMLRQAEINYRLRPLQNIDFAVNDFDAAFKILRGELKRMKFTIKPPENDEEFKTNVEKLTKFLEEDAETADARLNVFISYRKLDHDVTYVLAEHLEKMESHVKRVWIDKELTPGKHWWDEILTEIRNADVVITAMSDNYLASEPCRLEYNYAKALGKNILPIAVGNVDYNLLPPELAVIQMPTYRPNSETSTKDILKAFAELPAQQPLPDPLPIAPTAPLSELNKVEARAQKERLNSDDEAHIYRQLRYFARKGDEQEKVTASKIVDNILARRKQDISGAFYEELLELQKEIANSEKGFVGRLRRMFGGDN